MFGSKTKPNSKTNSENLKSNDTSNPLGTTCVIASGTRIEGKFTSSEDIRLDGVIVGEVSCGKRMVMGQSGQVEGNVQTVDSAVSGKVKGEIRVSGTLHLHETANIDGSIVASKMIVDSGASYSGDCKVGDQHFKK